MTLIDFEAQLRGSIQEGQLELNETTTGIDAMARLFEGVSDNGSVLIRNARLSRSDAQVTVEGQASFLNVPEIDVVAIFVSTGGVIGFTMLGKLPASWSFSQSFPELPPYTNYSPKRFNEGPQKSFFHELSLTRPGFIFSTYAHRDDSYQVDIKEGLNFVADLAMKGPLDVIGLFAGDQQLTLSGAIELKGKSAGLNLLARFPVATRIGPVALEDLAVTLHSDLSSSAPNAKAGIRFGSTVRLGKSVRMQLATDIPIGFRDAMILSGEFENLTLPGLEALADIAGGDLSSSLPEGLKNLPTLGIDKFIINFSLTDRTINEVSFSLKTTSPWDLDGLTIKDIALDFKIISPLDKAKRALQCTIFGGTTLAGGDLGLFAALPEFQITSALAENQYINLSRFLREVASLPLDVPPKLVIDQLYMSANPLTKSFGFTLSVDGDWEFELGPKRLAITDLSMALNRSGGPAAQATGYLRGTFNIAGTEMTITGELGENFVLTGKIPSLKLTTIAAEFLDGVELPDEVPDLEFSDIDISLTPGTGAFTLKGQAKAKWDLPFGAPGLKVTTMEIDLQKDASTGTGAQRVSGPISCSLKLNGEGPVDIVDGLVFKKLAFSFDLDGQKGQKSWTLSGSIFATVFDADYTLAASLQQTPTLRKISLTAATTSAPMVNLEGVGSLSGKSIAINIAKAQQPAATATAAAGTATTGTATTGTATTGTATTETATAGTATTATTATGTATTGTATTGTTATGTATTGTATDTPGTSVSLSPSSPYTWDVSITGGMKVNNVFDLEGTLQLYKQTDRTGLAFKAQKAEVEIPLPVPQQSIKFHLGLGYVSIVRTTTVAGAAATWAFDAAVDVWFTGLPPSVQKILAQKVIGHLRMDADQMMVSINRVLQPLELQIPDIQTGSQKIELGKIVLDASNLMLLSRGGQLTLSMDFGVGLPSKLNNVFGQKADGTPSTLFFNTYQKDNPATISRFRLGIDTVGGLTIQTVTSPIAAVRLVVEGQNTWWHVNLGEFGKIKLMVPVFSYTGGSFVARGGFQQIEPLKVPLTPFKLLLSAAGLEATSAALPKGIPLQDLDIYDEKTKSFKFDEFIKTLETVGLPTEARDALRLIESRVDALPDRFKSYFDIKIPDRFEFNISITPDGTACGKVWVTGDKPIKLLYPTMGPLGPVMTGIELYSFTFGEILGGSLLLLNIDIRIDQYDLLQLAAALALPLDKLPILPDTRSLSRHLVIKNLFMLIVYQAVIPLPVPLFFDQLGLEYLGLEGLELQTHWGFPRPRLNPSDAARYFKDFEGFFTKPGHLLDADTPPKGLDLRLIIGPNYIQLPKYLGGKSLGSKDEKINVSAYQSLAHLFNALKTLNLNELIQALPLEKRVGSEQVSFAGMTLMTSWLITTPAEFRQVSHKQLGVADDQIESTLQVLPASPNKNDQGLVVFLKGDWKIAGTVSLRTTFGLVGTSTGFGTGLHVAGTIADLFDVELSGIVVIDTKAQDVFSLKGHSHLRISDDEIFAGDFTVTENRFAINGRLDLFSRSPALRITGQFAGRVSDTELYIFGSVSVTVGSYFTLTSAAAEITHAGITVAGTWLNQTVTFSAQRVGSGVQLQATLSPVSIDDAFKISNAGETRGPLAVLGISEEAGKAASPLPRLYLSGRIYLLGISADGAISFSAQGFEFTVEGQIFNLFSATLTAKGSNLLNGEAFFVKATMKNDLLAYLKEHATDAIKDATSSSIRQISEAQAQIDKARADVNSLNRTINEIRATIERERAQDQARLNEAQIRVRDAQDKVDDINRQIDAMRRTVEREREPQKQKLKKAQAAAQNAQDEVDNLDGQIEEAQREIRKIKRQIKEKEDWYDDSPKIKKAYRWAELGEYVTRKKAEEGVQRGKIKTLELSKKLAAEILKKYNDALGEAESAINSLPIDADPRVVGLIGAREGPNKVLDLSNLARAQIHFAIKKFPVDLDPRIAGLITARNTAQGSLVAASLALGRVKSGIGALAGVSDYIIRNGLGGLLDVRAAGFEASLNAAKGGRVAMTAHVVYMGTPKSLQFTFDFLNPASGAQALAQTLLTT